MHDSSGRLTTSVSCSVGTARGRNGGSHTRPPSSAVHRSLMRRSASTTMASVGALRGTRWGHLKGIYPRGVVGGNGVTGADFVADPAIANDLEQRLAAAVTDMETVSVAEVAPPTRRPLHCGSRSLGCRA